MSVPTFDANAITGMTGLKDKPVFFLKLNHSPTPTVVVKGDSSNAAAEVAIQWGSKLMKNVQNGLTNTKILSSIEQLAFYTAVMKYLPAQSREYANSTLQKTWVKMTFVPGLSDADFLNDKAKLDPDHLAQVIPKLAEAKAWEDLGKVIAVDIFIGNSDRFSVDPVKDPPGTWVNRGNLMFLTAGQPTRVIGLDMFDPNGAQQSDLRARGGFETLKVLTDPAARDRFARTATKSVGAEMNRRMRGINLASINVPVQTLDGLQYTAITQQEVSDLFIVFANDLSRGIEAGARDLKQYLTAKVQQYHVVMPVGQNVAPMPVLPNTPAARNIAVGTARVAPPARPGVSAPAKTIPQGILDRMRYLGWL